MVEFISEQKLGVYRHYKGSEYEVIAFAKHTETLENMVCYKAVKGNSDKNRINYWVRPLSIFFSKVNVDGKEIPRFKFIG